MIQFYKYLHYEVENSKISMWIGHSSGKNLCSEIDISRLQVFTPLLSPKGKAVLIRTIFLGRYAFVLFNIKFADSILIWCLGCVPGTWSSFAASQA